MGTALLVGLGFTASRVWAGSEPRENRCSLLLARVKRRQLLAARTQAATGEPGEDAAGTASVQEVDGAPATAARPVASESKPFSPKSLLLCRRVPCSFFLKKKTKNVGTFLRASAWLLQVLCKLVQDWLGCPLLCPEVPACCRPPLRQGVRGPLRRAALSPLPLAFLPPPSPTLGSGKVAKCH